MVTQTCTGFVYIREKWCRKTQVVQLIVLLEIKTACKVENMEDQILANVRNEFT